MISRTIAHNYKHWSNQERLTPGRQRIVIIMERNRYRLQIQFGWDRQLLPPQLREFTTIQTPPPRETSARGAISYAQSNRQPLQTLVESLQGTEQLGVAELWTERYQGDEQEELLFREKGTTTTTLQHYLVNINRQIISRWKSYGEHCCMNRPQCREAQLRDSAMTKGSSMNSECATIIQHDKWGSSKISEALG